MFGISYKLVQSILRETYINVQLVFIYHQFLMYHYKQCVANVLKFPLNISCSVNIIKCLCLHLTSLSLSSLFSSLPPNISSSATQALNSQQQ